MPGNGELVPTIDERIVESDSDNGPAEIGTFAAPIDVISRPGDATIYVVELLGTVQSVDPAGATKVALDLGERVLVEGERGLLGAAFSPDGEFLYVHFSNQEGDSVLAEFAFDEESRTADELSYREVLTVEQPLENHNGGKVAFGPDELLYIGFGDGGLAGDPERAALDLSSRLGKILRIDPRPQGESPFTVPEDNPYIDEPDADPTIWSYGLRNPWKFAFDSVTGDLWIADVGQDRWEEVNRGAADDNGENAGRGLNFGWSAFEGTERYNDDQSAPDHVAPFHSYERADGACSISGGAVYRGASRPDLDGAFVYGDYCTGQVFALNTAEPNAEPAALAQVDALVSISVGPDGELYAASVAGSVLRLT